MNNKIIVLIKLITSFFFENQKIQNCILLRKRRQFPSLYDNHYLVCGNSIFGASNPRYWSRDLSSGWASGTVHIHIPRLVIRY